MSWIQKRYRRLLALGIFLIANGTAFALENPPMAEAARAYTNADILLLFIYVLLALVFSFLCSVAEAVLLSITPSYIEGLREHKPKLSALLKRLRQDNVDQSLAAILTLNTIAHTAGAIGSGAKATIIFGSAWFGFFSAIMTLMILFLSEIIPKTLGAIFWRKLAGATAVYVRSLIFLLYPLIRICEWLTRLIARHKAVNVFSRDEFIAMARMGEQAGSLDREESRIIRNLFRLALLKVGDIMTPRTVISALRQDITVMEAMAAVSQTPFSRLPVYGENLDDITGFVLKSDLFLCKARDDDGTKLSALKRDILTVAEKMSLSGLLELLLDKRQHIAIVTDEFGGTEGLVTLEDVVETLLGMEIMDEMDKVEDMQALARQQWVKRARALGMEMEASRQYSLEKKKPAK